MNRRLFGAFGVLAIAAAASVGGCKNDPLSDTDGSTTAVVANFSYLQMSIGSDQAVTASALDARGTPLAEPVTFTACTGDVTVANDTSYHPIPATSSRAIVTAVTANPSCVVAAVGGVADTVTVAVLPPNFSGAFSATTVAGGDTLTINSTTLLKFDTASVTVSFGGAVATVVAKTRDVIKVLVPFGANGTATIGGIAVTYAPGLVISLPSTTSVTQTGDAWAGDDDYGTAPTIPLPAAVGQSTHLIVSPPATDNTSICGEASGPCSILAYTVADSANLTFTVDWDSGADIDTYSCSGPDASTCFEDTGTGATGAQPQSFTFVAAPGTHYLVVENFDHTPTTNYYVTITRLAIGS
jgi:hypothetical protein